MSVGWNYFHQNYNAKILLQHCTGKIIKDFLRRICPEFQFPREEQLDSKNEQHADAGGAYHLDHILEETAEVKPFQEEQVAMVKNRQDQYIYSERRPAHGFGRWFAVVEFRRIFGCKDVDHERPDISDQHARRSMKTRCHHEIVQCKPGKKADEQ